MLEKELREQYTWTAYYDDGTELPLICKCGFKHVYHDIDRTKLAAFGILKDNSLIYRVFLEPGQKLIYRRRPSGDFKTGEILGELILVGTQQKIGGQNIQNIAYINVETGLIQIAGKWVGGEPNLTPGELNG